MKLAESTESLPKPFLKWVGGKRQLIPELIARIERLEEFGRYHEPFVGGGALFFELARRGELGRKKAFLSDANPNLIVAYQGVQRDVDSVIRKLRKHQAKHDPDHYETTTDYYYGVRAEEPTELAERAARVIYLNKTCYNGLYRENRRGEFNVPMGRYKNPLICDEPTLRAASNALQRATLSVQHFAKVLDKAEEGDLVYFDPPYVPVSKTASFTDYAAGGFGLNMQEHLRDVFAELSSKGVYVLLSNSMTETVETLYRKFNVEPVLANRAVNSRADKRGKVKEALVSNF